MLSHSVAASQANLAVLRAMRASATTAAIRMKYDFNIILQWEKD